MKSASVGIRDAKINLSKYLKMVRKGTEIIITDRGKPVGKIVPIKSAELPLADRIKRLEAQGLLKSPNQKQLRKIPPPIPLPNRLAQVYLQQDRDDV